MKLSLIIFFLIATKACIYAAPVEIIIDDLYAKAKDTLPVNLVIRYKSQPKDISGATSLKLTLSYNSSMITPVNAEMRRTITYTRGIATLPLTISPVPQSGVITTIPMYVLLGDDYTTVITITSAKFEGANVETKLYHGYYWLQQDINLFVDDIVADVKQDNIVNVSVRAKVYMNNIDNLELKLRFNRKLFAPVGFEVKEIDSTDSNYGFIQTGKIDIPASSKDTFILAKIPFHVLLGNDSTTTMKIVRAKFDGETDLYWATVMKQGNVRLTGICNRGGFRGASINNNINLINILDQ